MGFVSIALVALLGQQPASSPPPSAQALIHDIQIHQKHMDDVRENYTFRQILTTDELDAHGKVRKAETEEREMFFVNGHRVDRLVKTDGRPLTPEEERAEDDRVRREAKKFSKSPQAGGRELVELSRILGIIDLSAPRRAMLNGRSTWVVDFTGDPDAKAHGMLQHAARKVTGTVWIDEADRDVVQLEASFHDSFRIGAGLLATIQKGTSIRFVQIRVADQIWMPFTTEIHLAARELMFNNIRQNIHVKDSDYRRFEVDSEEHQQAPAAIAAGVKAQ